MEIKLELENFITFNEDVLKASSIGLKDGQLLITGLCTLARLYKIPRWHPTVKIFLYNESEKLCLSSTFSLKKLILSWKLITKFRVYLVKFQDVWTCWYRLTVVSFSQCMIFVWNHCGIVFIYFLFDDIFLLGYIS